MGLCVEGTAKIIVIFKQQCNYIIDGTTQFALLRGVILDVLGGIQQLDGAAR